MRSPRVAAQDASNTTSLLPPRGLRDSVGEHAVRRHQTLLSLESTFSQQGFTPIYLPPFERFANVAPAMLHRQDAELIRFVDPADDQIAVLPADATPQVARLFARQQNQVDLTNPWKVFYRQNIIRAGNQRGRTRRQRLHVGCECIAAPSPDGEVALVHAIIAACEALGLRELVFEIGHVAPVISLLEAMEQTDVTAAQQDALRAALRAKDRTKVSECLAQIPNGKSFEKRAIHLLSLHGSKSSGLPKHALDALDEAELATAEQCQTLASASSAITEVHFDFGDVSTISYYTGLRFSLHLPGIGEPLGSGGRYDSLMSKFGANAQAIGFSFDVDNVDRALRLQTKDDGET